MEAPLFCDRCSAELTPGAGNFYVVTIEAVADPTPPVIEQRSPEEIRAALERTLAQLAAVSGQEALDQVYRRVTIYLCRPCYQEWIENPAGS
jgi:hypothetical protein